MTEITSAVTTDSSLFVQQHPIMWFFSKVNEKQIYDRVVWSFGGASECLLLYIENGLLTNSKLPHVSSIGIGTGAREKILVKCLKDDTWLSQKWLGVLTPQEDYITHYDASPVMGFLVVDSNYKVLQIGSFLPGPFHLHQIYDSSNTQQYSEKKAYNSSLFESSTSSQKIYWLKKDYRGVEFCRTGIGIKKFALKASGGGNRGEKMELKKTFFFTDALNSNSTRLLATATISRSDSVSSFLILEDKDVFQGTVRSCISILGLAYLRWKFKLPHIRLRGSGNVGWTIVNSTSVVYSDLDWDYEPVVLIKTNVYRRRLAILRHKVSCNLGTAARSTLPARRSNMMAELLGIISSTVGVLEIKELIIGITVQRIIHLTDQDWAVFKLKKILKWSTVKVKINKARDTSLQGAWCFTVFCKQLKWIHKCDFTQYSQPCYCHIQGVSYQAGKHEDDAPTYQLIWSSNWSAELMGLSSSVAWGLWCKVSILTGSCWTEFLARVVGLLIKINTIIMLSLVGQEWCAFKLKQPHNWQLSTSVVGDKKGVLQGEPKGFTISTMSVCEGGAEIMNVFSQNCVIPWKHQEGEEDDLLINGNGVTPPVQPYHTRAPVNLGYVATLDPVAANPGCSETVFPPDVSGSAYQLGSCAAYGVVGISESGARMHACSVASSEMSNKTKYKHFIMQETSLLVIGLRCAKIIRRWPWALKTTRGRSVVMLVGLEVTVEEPQFLLYSPYSTESYINNIYVS